MIVLFGDSLTENNGQFASTSEHWSVKIKNQITASGFDAKRTVTVINEGIGGENSSDALARLPGVLATYKPTHIILTHGTNDIPPFCCGFFAQPQANLQAMAALAKQAGVIVIMGEFTLKVYGTEIANGYTDMYVKAAKNSNSVYVNLTNGIPYDSANYNADGLHFSNGSQEAIKNNATAALFPLL